MDDYLTKPVQIDQLSAKIAHWRERDNTPMAPGLGAGTMGR
jgi:DNA-binding response OmpR family regulator